LEEEMATRDLAGDVCSPEVGASNPVVVAVIPAYNEERFIASVVISALRYADRIIVVDDGSRDGTAMMARMAGAEVVQRAENGGKGQALNAGFARALDFAPDAIVTLDGDAQHDPAEIPNLVRPILAGNADVVIGSRFLQTRSRIPRWRQVGQHTLTVITNRASGMATTDSQSGYRAFNTLALSALHFETAGLAMESEMQFILRRSALRISEVPISVQYRDGNKRNPVVHGLAVIDSILSLVAQQRPLIFFGIPGAVLMVLGFLIGIAVIHIVDTQHVVPIGTVVLSTLLLIFGLTLSIAGLILHSLDHFMRRIQQELRAVARGFPASRTTEERTPNSA
jgi:glycosyltransferase involved in cell wall biosynthesis